MSVFIEKEAKTVEQAIDKGLAQMGIQREDVEIEIVSLGTAGFLGIFGGKPAKVRLKVLPQPRVKRLVESILEKMEIPGMVSSFHEEGNILVATIDSFEGEKYLKSNQGAAISAMEYLINKIYRDSEYEVRLDIGGFREKQNDDLKSRALQLAAKVKESGQEHKMEPMPPHQRKIVHKTLENSPDVKTFAVGNADFRRVIIAPRLPGDKPGQRGAPITPRHESGDRGKFRGSPKGKLPQPRPAGKGQPQARPAPPKPQPAGKVQPQVRPVPPKPQPARERPAPKPANDFKSRSKSPKGPRPQTAAKNENALRSTTVASGMASRPSEPFVPRGKKTKGGR
ncbi:MAG: Jag N-terminal domain-containing protein [Candidatus Edwardsbacteria bacterium]|nr:Jag N-terminal domain-containing protein [Candidatus Edwardsbacteria bacterium]MBU1577189.1 Jag N-terminal domain-containing protein [Candidatus Edwardsbacteria bacterium]MBU2463736.1 Jag N-terminal domain-containing protein [Candidatus Edwardsbacteria bacterium]MBU2594090.1 Jag N-terminal domain-containing protein [Candidatus Edwardsbacteria bacterium]